MNMVILVARREVTVCSGWGWEQSHSPVGEAGGSGRQEGKIEETGTVDAGFEGKALLCTLLGGAARGTMFFWRQCRRFAGSPAFSGFLAALWQDFAGGRAFRAVRPGSHP